MTRKEAIGRIQEHRRIHSKKEPFTPYLDKAFDMAIEALKEQRPQKWIPCFERLPEEHGYYLVQTDGSHNAVIDIAEYGKLWSKRCEDFVWEWNKASRVIAWMPLPEPYKEEGDK